MASTSARKASIAQHGHARLPDAVDLTIQSLKDGRMRCVYTETFAPGKEPASVFEDRMKTSIPALRAALPSGSKVTRHKNRITIVLVADRQTVGDAMTAEFLAWGHLGNITIRNLLALITLAHARQRK